MTKKMGLMALGLSMVLLSGCGSSDNDNGGGTTPPDGGTNLNIPAEATKNIVGTWATGCINEDGGESEWEILTFNADGTGAYEGTEYSGADCNPADEVDYEKDDFSYTLGEATKGSAGKDAVEIDIAGEGWDYYSMVHFYNSNKLSLADDSDDNDGDTRANDFDDSYAFTKQ